MAGMIVGAATVAMSSANVVVVGMVVVLIESVVVGICVVVVSDARKARLPGVGIGPRINVVEIWAAFVFIIDCVVIG